MAFTVLYDEGQKRFSEKNEEKWFDFNRKKRFPPFTKVGQKGRGDAHSSEFLHFCEIFVKNENFKSLLHFRSLFVILKLFEKSMSDSDKNSKAKNLKCKKKMKVLTFRKRNF